MPRLNKAQLFHFRWTPNAGGNVINVNNFCFNPMGKHNYTYAKNQTGKTSLIFIILSAFMKQNIKFGEQKRQLYSYIENTRADAPGLLASEWISDVDPEYCYLVLNWIYLTSNLRGRNLKFSDLGEKYGAIYSYKKGTLTNPVKDLGLLNSDDLNQAAPKSCSDARVALSDLPTGVIKITGMVKLDNASPERNPYFREVAAMHLGRSLFEDVLMKVDAVEGGISEYFDSAKNSKQLLESRLLPTVLESHKEEIDKAESMYANFLKQSADSKDITARASFLNTIKPDVDDLPLSPYLQSYQVLQNSWKHRFDIVRSFRQENERVGKLIRELDEQVNANQESQTQFEYSISVQELKVAKDKLVDVKNKIAKNDQAIAEHEHRLKEIKRLNKLYQLFKQYQVLISKKQAVEVSQQRLMDAQRKLNDSDRKKRLDTLGSQLKDFYQQTIDDIQDKRKSYKDQQQALNNKVKEFRDLVDGVKIKITKNNFGQNSCQQKLASVKAQIDAFNQQNQVDLQSLSDYQQWNVRLSDEHAQVGDQLKDLQDELESLRRQQQELNNSWRNANQRVAEAKVTLSEAQRVVNGFNAQEKERQKIINDWKLSVAIFDGKGIRDQLADLDNNNHEQLKQLEIENHLLEGRVDLLSAKAMTKLPEKVSQVFKDKGLPIPQPGLEFLQSREDAESLLNECPILPFAFLVDGGTFECLDQLLTKPLLEPLVFFNRDHLDEHLIFGTGSAKVITNFDHGLLNNDYLLKEVQNLRDQIEENKIKIGNFQSSITSLAGDQSTVSKTLNLLTLENKNKLDRQLQQEMNNVDQANANISKLDAEIKNCNQSIILTNGKLKQLRKRLNNLSTLQRAGEIVGQSFKTVSDEQGCLSELRQEAQELQNQFSNRKLQLTASENKLAKLTEEVNDLSSRLQFAISKKQDFVNQYGANFNYIPGASQITGESYVKRTFQDLLAKYQEPIQVLNSDYHEKQDQYVSAKEHWEKESVGDKQLANEVADKDFDQRLLKQQVNAISVNEADDLQEQINQGNKLRGRFDEEKRTAENEINTCQSKVNGFSDGIALLTGMTINQLKQQLADIKQQLKDLKGQRAEFTRRNDLLDGLLADVSEVTLPESSEILDLSKVSLVELKNQWAQSTNQLADTKIEFSKSSDSLAKQVRTLKKKVDNYPYYANNKDKEFSNALQNQWLLSLENIKTALLNLTKHLGWFHRENDLSNSVETFHSWLENIENSKEITAMNKQMNSLNEIVFRLIEEMYFGLENLYKSSKVRTPDGKSKCLFEFRQSKYIGRALASENGCNEIKATIKETFDTQRNSFFNDLDENRVSDAEREALYHDTARKLITPNWIYNEFIRMDQFQVKYRQLDHVLKGDAQLVNYEDSKASGAASQVIYFVLLAMILRYQLDDKQGFAQQEELLSGMNKNAIWVPLIVDNLAGKVSDSNLYKAILKYADQMHIQFITLADQKDNTSVMSAFGSRFGFLRKVKMGNSNEVQLVFSWKDWQTEDDGQEVDFDLTK